MIEVMEEDFQSIRFYFLDADSCVHAIVRLSASGEQVYSSYDEWQGKKFYYVEVYRNVSADDAV